MRLTTQRYYTPSGTSIQATGIVPDIEVKQAKLEEVTQPQRRRESDLRGALENGNAPSDPEASDLPEGEAGENGDVALEDYQLARAIDLLRGLALYNKRSSAN